MVVESSHLNWRIQNYLNTDKPSYADIAIKSVDLLPHLFHTDMRDFILHIKTTALLITV
jgi:hypothetical protein